MTPEKIAAAIERIHAKAVEVETAAHAGGSYVSAWVSMPFFGQSVMIPSHLHATVKAEAAALLGQPESDQQAQGTAR